MKEDLRKSIGLSWGIVLGCVIVLVGSGHAAASSTPITHCGFAITAAGTNFLAHDLGPCAPPFAIQIVPSNVRLRLEGHTIAGTGEHPGGVFEGDGIVATAVHNVKIKGPGAITAFVDGIRWQTGDHSEVKGVRASQNENGSSGLRHSEGRFL
jgi:hypothetical protein